MSYAILKHSTPEGLTNLVRGYIQQGWYPVGSHMVTITQKERRFSGKQHIDTIYYMEYTQTIVKTNLPINEDYNIEQQEK